MLFRDRPDDNDCVGPQHRNFLPHTPAPAGLGPHEAGQGSRRLSEFTRVRDMEECEVTWWVDECMNAHAVSMTDSLVCGVCLWFVCGRDEHGVWHTSMSVQ